MTPLYVGQALSIRYRVRDQFNNLKLMRGIQRAQIGRRVLLLGEILTKPGQKIKRVLNIVELSLIEHFVEKGYELLNKQGARLHYDTVTFEGNLLSRRLFDHRFLNVPRR